MSARSQVLEDTEVYEQRNPRRAMQTRTRETKGWYQTADLRTVHSGSSGSSSGYCPQEGIFHFHLMSDICSLLFWFLEDLEL